MSSLRSLPALCLLPAFVLACEGFRDPSGEGNDEASDSNVTVDDGELEDDTDTGPGCQSDADCEGNPGGPICDPGSGQCFPDCKPGTSETCYEGPEGTAQIGICKIGSRACQADGTWGGCTGQVLPQQEDCENGIDDDCDGNVDATDLDGDGFFSCIDGPLADCCDEEVFGCIDAHLVNPGAFEVPGNEVDDDCDNEVDEAEPSCDAAAALDSDSDDPLDYARALDLCQITSEDQPTWGVLDGSLSLANGQNEPLAVQHSIRQAFGDVIEPLGGSSLIVLSSGNAAAPGQSQPSYAAFESGQNLNTAVPAPSDWIAANGGQFPASCPDADIAPDSTANDSVMLTLRVRVPTNARSFSAKMYFFSAEYPEWVCSNYNDFFVALLGSTAETNPTDGNIAVFDDGETLWPVGLNILKTAPGLFGVCESGNVGCQGLLPQSPYDCPAGPAELAGTGFDVIDTTNSCNGVDFPIGGATGWLTMNGNVEPGEIIDLRFAVWDSGGHLFDALVLLDDWQWSLDAASPGVQLP